MLNWFEVRTEVAIIEGKDGSYTLPDATTEIRPTRSYQKTEIDQKVTIHERAQDMEYCILIVKQFLNSVSPSVKRVLMSGRCREICRLYSNSYSWNGQHYG